MKSILAEEDHRQQAGAGPATGDRMERRRRLGDLLARPAGELLADGLDHLPLPGDHLQRLGDVLAELDQLALAARANRGRRDDDALSRQLRWQRRSYRLAARGAAPSALVWAGLRGRGRHFGGARVLTGACLQLLELQLQLVKQPAPVLRGRSEPLALQLGNQQLQMGDHRLGAGRPRLGLAACRALGEERRLQRLKVVGNGVGRAAHAADRITKSAG